VCLNLSAPFEQQDDVRRLAPSLVFYFVLPAELKLISLALVCSGLCSSSLVSISLPTLLRRASHRVQARPELLSIHLAYVSYRLMIFRQLHESYQTLESDENAHVWEDRKKKVCE
jgi:hypothetical protein